MLIVLILTIFQLYLFLASQLAGCMSLLMECVEQSSLESIVVADQESYLKQIQEIESSVQGGKQCLFTIKHVVIFVVAYEFVPY